MNDPREQDLASGLATLTEWTGATGDLWRAAPGRAAVVARRASSWRAGLLAASLLLAIGALVVIPMSGRARAPSRIPADGQTAAALALREAVRRSAYGADLPAATDDAADSTDLSVAVFGEWLAEGADDGAAIVSPSSPESASSAAELADAPRLVVHRATIELKSQDVRVAFLRAGQIASEARAEYIQDSFLNAADDGRPSTVTLRVRADRLATALDEIRALGAVLSEQVKGDDVTSQAVDIEARLRNERRIEFELLELLAARDDAPLKDITEVRTTLASVRARIEQLEGQRNHLSRLVSLATILVVIHPEKNHSRDPDPASIWLGIGDDLHGAWKSGVQSLGEWTAWLLRVLVSRAPIWLLLAAVSIAIWRRRRSFAARMNRLLDPTPAA